MSRVTLDRVFALFRCSELEKMGNERVRRHDVVSKQNLVNTGVFVQHETEEHSQALFEPPFDSLKCLIRHPVPLPACLPGSNIARSA